MEAHATITAILALQKRADEYGHSAKCGYAAAAEKLQEAVVLAQRLPGLPEDNLVALSLQGDRCRFLLSQALRMCSLSEDKAGCQGFVTAASSSLQHLTAALIDRMDAGTLQPGRCAPLEEAWFESLNAGLDADAQSCLPDVVRDLPPVLFGSCVGLAAMYVAAENVCAETMFWLISVPQPETLTLIVRALDLLCKPRPLEDTLLVPELYFVRAMLDFEEGGHIQRKAEVHPSCAAQLQKIGDAWARVQASGVLRRRCLNYAGADGAALVKVQAEENKRNFKAVDAREARRGLRSCGLTSCGAKEAHVDHFKRCGACRAAVYCCKEHQVQAWPAHKAECKAARKAAAEDQ